MRHGWSLDRSPWYDLSRGVAHGHWRQVPFATLHQARVPEASGVYALCTAGVGASTGLFADLYNAIYVGQARNLRQRFMQHCRRPSRELQRAILCFRSLDFWFVQVSPGHTDATEALLIECLGPSANLRAGVKVEIGAPVSL